MSATLNVFVKDKVTKQGIGDARVTCLTRNQIIDPPTRQTSGDGGCNLYFQGPGFTPAVAVSLIVDAPGYKPNSTNDKPILFGTSDVNYTIELESFRKPFRAAPRFWKANMGGTRVAGLPFVSGMEGAPAGLFLSWFYDRYDTQTRTTLRAAMKAKKYTHWLLSWPDARTHGATVASFKALCQELISDGFYPCVFLCSKDHDPADVPSILAGVNPLLDALVGVVPMFCLGWELSLWLDPIQVEMLRDTIAPRCLKQPGTLVYLHLQEGYGDFRRRDVPATPTTPEQRYFFKDFWNPSVGKLTGILHQKILAQNKDQYRGESGGLVDIMQRFAGGFQVVTDSGFGHPFDLVALEITAMQQFNGTCSESEGDLLGQWACDTPVQIGPTGVVVAVMGSGNGSL